MEEDIKILEEFINNYKSVQEKYKDDEIQAEIERSCYFEEVPAQAIENLLKRYKELEEEVESEKFYHNADKEFIQKYHDEASELNTKCINLETQLSNSIPISVIQNKKSELEEKRIEEFINYGYSENYYHMTSEIAVLDEILEKGNK